MVSALDIFILCLCTFLGNTGVALTGFGMAIIFVFIWQISALSGYTGDFKYAVFIQAFALFCAQPLLLYKAQVFQHASRRMLLYFIPITIAVTPLGQITADRVSTEVVQAVAGILVLTASIFEVYQKRSLYVSWIRCSCIQHKQQENPEEPKETTNKKSKTSDYAALELGEDTSSFELTFESNYDIGKKLGEGRYSIVNIAHQKNNGSKFAVKVVEKSKLLDKELAKVQTEIDIMKSITGHPNIVQVFEVFDEPNKIFIVSELMNGGDLFDLISSSGSLSESHSRSLLKSLVSALDYLHARKIAHRDLKPENLLLKTDQCNTCIKLADFGFATRVTGPLVTLCGTPAYVAPEIINSRPYDMKVDCWSFGVICFVMIAGYQPFEADDEDSVYRLVQAGKFAFHKEHWSSISNEAKDFISALLTIDPKERLSAASAINHTWFTSPICDSDDCANNNPSKDLNKSPEIIPKFFMIGSQRSGSNWLRTMLDEREDLAAPHPPHIMRDYAPIINKFGDLRQESNFKILVDHVATFVEHNQVPWTDKHGFKIKFNRNVLFAESKASIERIKQARVESDRSIGLIDSLLYLLCVFDAIMNYYTRVNGKHTWMCKSMGMSKFHDLLLEFYGDTQLRYIYLVRDPRDVALSFMNTPVGDCHYYAIMKKWVDLQAHAKRILDETPHLILQVHYESMLKEKVKVVKELYDFIGRRRFGSIKRQASVMFMRPPEDCILSAKSGREAKKAQHLSYQFKNLVRGQSFVINQMEKWRHPTEGLSTEDLKLIESIAATTMKRLGYKPHLVGFSTTPTVFSEQDIMNFNEMNEKGITDMNNKLKIENPGDFERRRKQAEVLASAPTLLSKEWLSLDHNDNLESLHSDLSHDLFLSDEDLVSRVNVLPTKVTKLRSFDGITMRYAAATQRGYYPNEHDKPNQDAYNISVDIATDQNGHSLHWFSCYDGHGLDGHICAVEAAEKIPKEFSNLLSNGLSLEKSLEEAHITMHKQLLTNSNIKTDQSGTTATTVVFCKNGKCVISNLGDSTCILGSISGKDWIAKRLCTEHTPHCCEEFDRIVEAGGVIMTIEQHDGVSVTTDWQDRKSNPRIWSSTDDKFPGCNFTRSLGDSIAHSIGVIALPEISKYELKENDKIFLIVSDGITEFMSNEECIEIAKEFPMDPAEAARGLILEATSRWMKHSDYLDDITCVVLMLDNEQHEPFHIETGDELVMDESTNASVTPSSEAPLTINAQLWTFFAGATSGYLGGLCGIPGPSLILYFLHPPAGVTFTKKSQRATGSSITAINVATRIIYYLVNTLGMKQDANFKNKDWILYVCIALTSLLGILFGSKLFDLLSDNVATIRSILTIFLVLCGVSLLFSSYADV